MLVLKSVFLLFLLVEFAMGKSWNNRSCMICSLGIGYLVDGEYFPIPANAELVLENPQVPIANSPLGNDDQMKRIARDPAWRHIGMEGSKAKRCNLLFLGLGKKRSAPATKQRTWSMIGLGK